MPRLTLLVGLPASGKTRFAQGLAKTHPEALLLSPEEDISRMAREEDLSLGQAYKAFHHIADMLQFMGATHAFENFQDIIWDDANLDVERRKEILSIVPPGYEVDAVVFEAPDSLRHDRLEQDKITKGARYDPSTLLSMEMLYQRPDYDEPFDSISLFTPEGMRTLA